MIIVAFLSSFILYEKMYLGRVVGAGVIVLGLYFVVWGKQKDYKSYSAEAHDIPVKQSDASKLEVITNNVERDERLV
ncbi:WAT1-related protein-like protein [Salvia divinorum]|uniref:WAT1-related protein-like protein n=1 Tax=Salvia divinorum TaxID=28513 RepID=A0ABD1GP49_SALDI